MSIPISFSPQAGSRVSWCVWASPHAALDFAVAVVSASISVAANASPKLIQGLRNNSIGSGATLVREPLIRTTPLASNQRARTIPMEEKHTMGAKTTTQNRSSVYHLPPPRLAQRKLRTWINPRTSTRPHKEGLSKTLAQIIMPYRPPDSRTTTWSDSEVVHSGLAICFRVRIQAWSTEYASINLQENHTHTHTRTPLSISITSISIREVELCTTHSHANWL